MDLLGRLAGEVGDAGPDDLAERDPLDVRHGHEVISVDVAQLVDRQQRRAGQAAAALGLAAELGHAGRVVRQGRLEDLERDELDERLAAQGLPDVALAAAAEPLQQAVAAQPVAGRQRRPLAARPPRAPGATPRRTLAARRPAMRPDPGRRLDDPGAGPAADEAVGAARPRAIQQSPEEGPQVRVRGDDHGDGPLRIAPGTASRAAPGRRRPDLTGAGTPRVSPSRGTAGLRSTDRADAVTDGRVHESSLKARPVFAPCPASADVLTGSDERAGRSGPVAAMVTSIADCRRPGIR